MRRTPITREKIDNDDEEDSAAKTKEEKLSISTSPYQMMAEIRVPNVCPGHASNESFYKIISDPAIKP